MLEGDAHWDDVYRRNRDETTSWHRRDHGVSIALLERAGLDARSCVADIGAGEATLIETLLARGLSCLTALDISAVVLERARQRTGALGSTVRWVQGDVTADDWTIDPVDIWHDRAVFHFLVDDADRRRYVDRLHRHVRPGGGVIIATFASGGPERCSGLPVQRYDAAGIHDVLGTGFALDETRHEDHLTPWAAVQPFVWCRFTRLAIPR